MRRMVHGLKSRFVDPGGWSLVVGSCSLASGACDATYHLWVRLASTFPMANVRRREKNREARSLRMQ